MFAELDDEILAIIVNEHGKQPLAFVVYRVRQLNAITWTASQFFDGAFDRRESEYFVKLVGGQEKALGD
jgi:chemotaxis signal transduction protein